MNASEPVSRHGQAAPAEPAQPAAHVTAGTTALTPFIPFAPFAPFAPFGMPATLPLPAWPQAAWDYGVDAWQRMVLTLDILRERGNQTVEHEREGMPPVLVFDYEIVLDGRTLPDPVNYALLRIVAPEGDETDDSKRPFVVIDPRAGHGPGIGGFKIDSEIGIALRGGHPCYLVSFFPEPCPGQTIAAVTRAEEVFLRTVAERHPQSDVKPFVIGNCQGGWALMLLAASAPDLVGPILLAGSPLAYWSGQRGRNPMRYSGGLLGGSWASSFAADLGNGHFDGAYLVQNFEQLNPANALWEKLYNLYAKADTEGPRFLDFERWWGGHYQLNRDEIDWIVQNLFVGNRLTSGELRSPDGKSVIDLRNVRSPIVVFASWGDNITPPQQALNWIPDLYADVDEIVANEQVIVYCLHDSVGHLGIFVSSGVANREHTELFSALDLIDVLPPGLYEAVIEDIAPDTPHTDLIEGRYLMRFARRTIDDILALDDGRDDEQAFRVVRRVAEINQRCYDTFVSPAVRALSNEASAHLLRGLQSSRLERTLQSDANPCMGWVGALAPMVREHRRPVARDNPLLALEHAVSAAIVAALNQYRDTRDAWYEHVFETIYRSPLVQAMVGMDERAAATQAAPAAIDALRRELTARRIRDAQGDFDQGGPVHAFVRILAYVKSDYASIEERPFNLMRKMAREHMQQQASLNDLKQAARQQTFLVSLDARRALETLPALMPDLSLRPLLMIAIHRVLTLPGPLQGGELERYREVAHVLGTDHKEALPQGGAADGGQAGRDIPAPGAEVDTHADTHADARADAGDRPAAAAGANRRTTRRAGTAAKSAQAGAGAAVRKRAPARAQRKA
ncbi:DUF3141 domain-containing protein [Cupriavidus sp. USMAHM13]|uniref:DUF3141 domain-containing protein n=1 Tax=Cupriavidus sp. USMAHM13 TaxID=1389192 RepID=UPI000A9AC95A